MRPHLVCCAVVLCGVLGPYLVHGYGTGPHLHACACGPTWCAVLWCVVVCWARSWCIGTARGPTCTHAHVAPLGVLCCGALWCVVVRCAGPVLGSASHQSPGPSLPSSPRPSSRPPIKSASHQPPINSLNSLPCAVVCLARAGAVVRARGAAVVCCVWCAVVCWARAGPVLGGRMHLHQGPPAPALCAVRCAAPGCAYRWGVLRRAGPRLQVASAGVGRVTLCWAQHAWGSPAGGEVALVHVVDARLDRECAPGRGGRA
jgi:hypothetical protein